MRINLDLRGRTSHTPADSIFVDRESQSAVFSSALSLHRHRIDSEDDAGESMHNVLVFHGMGGIGKTSLSRRLESWARGALTAGNDWGPRPATHVDATMRIDLRDAGGKFDVTDSVITMRCVLGELKQKWPAFDLAFAAYWTASHPGEPLPGRDRKDNGFSEAVGETVGNILSDLGISGTAAGFGYRAVRAVANEFERRRDRHVAFGAGKGYAGFLSRCAEEPSPGEPRPELMAEMSQLLAHELSVWEEGRTPLVVVFVDTTERLTVDPRRSGEKLLNQLVHSMPNVLFVMTGRDSLDWYDHARTNLFAVGHAVWPGLVPESSGNPRQHLLGKLSPQDARKLLTHGREQYELPVPDQVVDHVVISSGGLPQYLELALIVARNVKDNGGTAVAVSDVDGSLGDLVSRVLEDVPLDEQRALRAASMFPYFDVELVAAAADVEHGCAERACTRPMVERWEHAKYPYRMHDEIRTAIRSTDHRVVGGWSRHDWLQAATRGLQEAHRRYEDASRRKDVGESMFALGLAIRVVCNEEVSVGPSDTPSYQDWLSKAIIFGPSISGLRAHAPAASKTAYGQKLLDFILAKTVELPIAERRTLLRAIFDSDHPLATAAGRHLAYTLRNSSQWDDSLAVWDELAQRSPGELHSYQRAMTLVLARRFSEAASVAVELPSTRRETLMAAVAMAHGQPRAWFAQNRRTVEMLESRKRQREALEHRGMQLRYRCLIHGDVGLEEILRLLEDAEAVGHDAAIRDCLLALALLAPAERVGVDVGSERLEWMDRAHNNGDLGYRAALAAASAAFVEGDAEGVRHTRRILNSQAQQRGRSWIPVECLLDSLGFPLASQDTDWVEPYETVRARWMTIFDEYRARVVAGAHGRRSHDR